MADPMPPHVQWLAIHRRAGLQGVLAAQGADLDVRSALEVLMAADPSPGLHAVQWLCDALIVGGMLWEDVRLAEASKAGQTLRWFVQHRGQLTGPARRLETYRSLGGVYRAVQHLVESETGVDATSSGRMLRRQASALARQDSLVLHESPGMIVAVPLSRRAGQWWGRGTRWCTAASDDGNMFEEYNKTGPLIVIVLRGAGSQDGELKLQLHIDGAGRVQFMDAADDYVDPALVGLHWDLLAPIMTWALERSEDIADYIPHSLWRGRVGELVVGKDGSRITDIDIEHRTPAICRAAVSNAGYCLGGVPMHLRDLELCTIAVNSWGNALEDVPLHLVDQAMCLQAVQDNGFALTMVPQHLRSPEIIRAAICKAGTMLRHVDHEHMDAELCWAAVHNDSRAIAHVPHDLCTPELAMLAVAKDGLALYNLDKAHWTPELAMAAVCQNPAALDGMPDRYATVDICRAAVMADAMALHYVAPGLRSLELCTMALERDGRLLNQVPTHLLSHELRMQAVRTAPIVMRNIAYRHRTREMYVLAVQGDGLMLEYVEDSMLDAELCALAVQQNPWTIEDIPRRYMTPELCMQAVKGKPEALMHIGEGDQTLDICLAAVRANPAVMQYVAERLQPGVMAVLGDSTPPPDVQVEVCEPQWNAAMLADLELALSRLCPHSMEHDSDNNGLAP